MDHIGEVLDALIAAGLRLEFLHEFPFHFRAKFPAWCRAQTDCGG